MAVDGKVNSRIGKAGLSNDGEFRVMRVFAVVTVMGAAFGLTACGPSYSPDTYATNAAQQANKVDAGVIVGVRPVQISAQGTVGGVGGAAAGGAAGSTIGAGTAGTFGAIGGSIIGGIAGVTAEHLVGDTNGFEYVVRKPNGDLISVTQKEEKPLHVGQKVLVIAGAQARIVPDYTVPFDPGPKLQMKADPPPGGAPAPKAADAAPEAPVPPSQVPPAFGGVIPGGSPSSTQAILPLLQGAKP